MTYNISTTEIVGLVSIVIAFVLWQYIGRKIWLLMTTKWRI